MSEFMLPSLDPIRSYKNLYLICLVFNAAFMPDGMDCRDGKDSNSAYSWLQKLEFLTEKKLKAVSDCIVGREMVVNTVKCRYIATSVLVWI